MITFIYLRRFWGIGLSDGCGCQELRDATCSDVTSAATWSNVRVLPAELELRETDGWILLQERCVDLPRLPGVFSSKAHACPILGLRVLCFLLHNRDGTTRTLPRTMLLARPIGESRLPFLPFDCLRAGLHHRHLSCRQSILDRPLVERALLFNKYSYYFPYISLILD